MSQFSNDGFRSTSSGFSRQGKNVLVVGAGTRFLSAMSYYTIRFTNALNQRFCVAVLPMRQLLPTFIYPGKSRVGSVVTQLEYDSNVDVLRGIDWYWGPGVVRTIFAVKKRKPDLVIFQWWTGTVLHSYLVIALLAKVLGASVVVEFHEVLDTSEDRIPMARAWVNMLGKPFFSLASGFVIHSESDRKPLEERYRLGVRPCVLIPHGPFDHHIAQLPGDEGHRDVLREAPEGVLNLLYFGIIRPYKGVPDLVEAFGLLGSNEAERYWLTIVGEIWEEKESLLRQIKNSPYKDRITLVDRFVDDNEIRAFFGGADAVVLPYHRSSASGPAHITMSGGLPLVVTAVGGLPAAVADYEGAILVPPRDPSALRDALRRIPELCGQLYKDPHSWDRTVSSYEDLIERFTRSL